MKTNFHSLAAVMIIFSLIFSACGDEDAVIPLPNPPNTQPNPLLGPTAHAGNDTTIYKPHNSVVLNGSKSTDPDDNIATYEWRLLSGPAYVEVPDISVLSKTTVNGLDMIGSYEFELTVTDADKMTSKDSVIVTVAGSSCSTRTGEYIFRDLVWDYSWIMEINIPNVYSYLPAGSQILKIFIKRDSSDEWEEVLGYSADYVHHTWQYGNGILVIIPDLNTQNDTPDIKIVYCY